MTGVHARVRERDPADRLAGDRFGARPVWIAALLIFMTGSVLAGAAWSIGALIAFRVIQGVGAGLIMPVGQTILARAAGPQRMGRVMSVVGVPDAAGARLRAGHRRGDRRRRQLALDLLRQPSGRSRLRCALALRLLPRSEPRAAGRARPRRARPAVARARAAHLRHVRGGRERRLRHRRGRSPASAPGSCSSPSSSGTPSGAGRPR